ncbi:YihY/virulence factor BrkB family protein [Clostridium sp. 'White wine YQ']|uniref:YihY/virulence factor BrkB family protein n=1 Tax=Clostridium sp. 'White wine YQ' TaxID=3027474 RepID=UPI002366F1D3|nr:YihY/virulence factor BrkB family protein [Clostridium sp. 'White wine YQ']MDD7795671.1 YihY/virulence factor BrkB family protein [Clostridium sp. 'White wine YQ']
MSKVYIGNTWTPWKFLKRLITKVNDDDIFALSAQLAYYLLLSFFPFLMFIMIMIGFSQLKSDEVLVYLSTILPQNVYQLVESTVVEVINGQKGQLILPTVLLAIWTSSSGFSAVNKGLDKAYEVQETRSYIKRTIYGIISTIGLGLIIILTLLLIVFGGVIRAYLVAKFPFDDIITFAWNSVRFAVIMLVMISALAAIYYFIPAKKVMWKECFPGAIISALGWIVVSSLFSFYVNNFSNYSRLYGSLGAVIALMTWLYISSVIVLLGGEINAILLE